MSDSRGKQCVIFRKHELRIMTVRRKSVVRDFICPKMEEQQISPLRSDILPISFLQTSTMLESTQQIRSPTRYVRHELFEDREQRVR